MLKSSGSSYLISGAKKVIYILTTSSQINVTAAESIYLMREYLSHVYYIYVFRHTETSMLVLLAPVAFKDPMIHGSAIHIAYRILAAFFIDMGAKTSIVENLVFYQPLYCFICLIY